jgi:ribonuclease VapC
MILDTSALVAILCGEPEARDFVERIHVADVSRISVANHVELSMVVESQLGPDGARQADAFLRRAGVIVEPFTLEHGELARQAFLDFGKGRRSCGSPCQRKAEVLMQNGPPCGRPGTLFS